MPTIMAQGVRQQHVGSLWGVLPFWKQKQGWERVFMIQGEPPEFTILNENVKNSNDNSLKDWAELGSHSRADTCDLFLPSNLQAEKDQTKAKYMERWLDGWSEIHSLLRHKKQQDCRLERVLCRVPIVSLSVVEETPGVQFSRVFESFSKKLCHLSIQSRGELSIAKAAWQGRLHTSALPPWNSLVQVQSLSSSKSIPISRWLGPGADSSPLEPVCPAAEMQMCPGFPCKTALSHESCCLQPKCKENQACFPLSNSEIKTLQSKQFTERHQAGVVVNFGWGPLLWLSGGVLLAGNDASSIPHSC